MTLEIEAKWFKSVREPATIYRVALEPYLAREMTRKLGSAFDLAVSTQSVTTSANREQRESFDL